MNSSEAKIDLWIEALKKSGFGMAVIASWSMSPVLNFGDKVYVRIDATSYYGIGDIIVFPVTDSLMIHRIVGSLWTPQGKFFIHKGDNASAMAFGMIKQEQVLGRAIIAKKDGKIILVSSLPRPRAIRLQSPFYSLLALERCVVSWLKRYLSQGKRI
jgi:signal peptidase I